MFATLATSFFVERLWGRFKLGPSPPDRPDPLSSDLSARQCFLTARPESGPLSSDPEQSPLIGEPNMAFDVHHQESGQGMAREVSPGLDFHRQVPTARTAAIRPCFAGGLSMPH